MAINSRAGGILGLDPKTLNEAEYAEGGGKPATLPDQWEPGLNDDPRYNLDSSAYQSPGQGINSSYWQNKMGQARQSGPNVDWARGLAGSGRGGMLGALQAMQSRPLASGALGSAMMRQGQQQVAGNMASQMAGAPGRFNPAAMRTAQMGMAGAGQNMALQAQQQAMAAAIQEQAAKDQALTQGWGALDANDTKRLAAEQDFWAKQQAAEQGWGKFGMADKAYEQALRQAYEQAKFNWRFSQRGSAATGDPSAAVIGAIGSTLGSIK